MNSSRSLRKHLICVQGHAAGRPVFEAVLARAEGVLHPMHVSAFDSLMPLVNCCRSAGDGAGASRHLARMLDTMEAVCGLPTVEVRPALRMPGDSHFQDTNPPTNAGQEVLVGSKSFRVQFW